MIGASALFAVAERIDQIASLTRLIIEAAMVEARRWPKSLGLSVNVTPADLAMNGFDRQFRSMLDASDVAGERVTLEITEQVLLGDLETARTVLTSLKKTGARIALDDFGAGFCNFRYLQELPIDALKLDRSLIERLPRQASDRAVFRAIVAMADALRLQVVAEGVESEAHLRVVRAEGADVWQGFHGAKPMSASSFYKLTTCA